MSHLLLESAVENVNGLIGQYVPKKTDFSENSPEYLRMIEDRLNNRPRKLLGWKTPMRFFCLILLNQIKMSHLLPETAFSNIFTKQKQNLCK